MKSIEIDNVGPIEHASIPVLSRGGIVRMRGRNGHGKSTALAAVNALHSEDALVLTPRAGTQFGTIQDPGGYTVRVGKRTTRKGELTIHQIEASAAARLVDPGIKDPDRADMTRARALCEILGVRAAVEPWSQLLLDPTKIDEAMGGRDQGDAPGCAAAVKGYLEEQARMQEQLQASYAERAKVKLAAAEEALRGIEAYPGNAQDDSVKTALALHALEQRRGQAQEAARRLPEVRAQLEGLPGLSEADAAAAVAAALEVGRQARAKVEGLERELEEVKKRLQAARAGLDVARAEHKQAESALTAARARGPLEERLRELHVKAVSGPLDEELQAAKDALARAKAGMAAQEMARRARGYQEEALDYERQAKAAEELAEDLRRRAAQVEPVLFSGLQTDLVSVQDGMLYGRHERLGMVRFGSLSHGERWRRALELVLRHHPKGEGIPVITMAQEGWEGLDPQNRAEINQIAQESGVLIITAEADSGELRAEVFGETLEAQAGAARE